MPSLTVVGTGIRAGLQLTPEARHAIAAADEVFYLTTETLTISLIEEINPRARSLVGYYSTNRPRSETYEEMVSVVIGALDAGRNVCAAFYGHPGSYVWPAHEAIRRAHDAGHDATMLPGISAEDCLIADLGIDPATEGWQSYIAEDFLIRPRRFDVHVPLILRQIAAIGEEATPEAPNRHGIQVLASVLQEYFGPDHPATIYVAATYPLAKPIIDTVPLAELATADVPPLATLYVPAASPAEADPVMERRLAADTGSSSSSPTTAHASS